MSNHTQRRLDRLEANIYKEPLVRLPGKGFYYVFGYTKEGRRVSLGPFMSEQEADDRLVELDDGEIFELQTKDLSKATRIIKAELISRGEDADEALRKMLHSKGLERSGGKG